VAPGQISYADEVSNFGNTFIFNPKFIKMHLSRSARNPHFSSIVPTRGYHYSFIRFPISHVLKNCWIIHPKYPYYRLSDNNCRVVRSSCNGLLLLVGYSTNKITNYKKVWFHFWIPAISKISNVLGYDLYYNDMYIPRYYVFVFGYDSSTDTYKVVDLSSTSIQV